LIFGRRGAGKTALMVEAKRRIQSEGHLSLWLNMQSYRHESAARAYLFVSQGLCEVVQTYYRKSVQVPRALSLANELHASISALLSHAAPDHIQTQRLIPRMQSMLKRFLGSNQSRLFVFLDDCH